MISNKKIIQFENRIGYNFKNKELLINSLTHPSFLIDNKKKKISIINDLQIEVDQTKIIMVLNKPSIQKTSISAGLSNLIDKLRPNNKIE